MSIIKCLNFIYLMIELFKKNKVSKYMNLRSFAYSTFLLLSLFQVQSFTPNPSQYTFSFFPFLEQNQDTIIEVKQQLGKEAVLQLSSLLPKLDTVGHDILRANHDFIQDVLHNELLNHEAKKTAILWSIKLAQYGDDFGSHVLQTYYDIVNACL